MPICELSPELQAELKRVSFASGEVVTERAHPERYERVRQLLDAALLSGYYLESPEDKGIQVMGLTETGRKLLQELCD